MSLGSACIGFITCYRHWTRAPATSGDGHKLLSRNSSPAAGYSRTLRRMPMLCAVRRHIEAAFLKSLFI